LLQRLRACNPAWEQFGTWRQVVEMIQECTPRDASSDWLLRAILERIATGEHELRSILLLGFWPFLVTTFHRKRHWDDEPDSRWQSLQWCFVKAITRIDLKRRPERLAQKILNDTTHFLHDECKADWDRTKREHPEEPQEMEKICSPQEAMEFAQVDLKRLQEEQSRRFRRLLNEKQITEADCFLLMATHIYGRSVREYADSVGISYETAKKRHQRAEARLRSRGDRCD
jgi:DNA-directed RNA polymerase specialized sigma24 family protein